MHATHAYCKVVSRAQRSSSTPHRMPMHGRHAPCEGVQDSAMVRQYARQYHRDIGELLRRIPRELLLLLKANDCLRSIDAVLGRPLNTLGITARACAAAAAEDPALSSHSLRGKCAAPQPACRWPYAPRSHMHVHRAYP
jgi:hypothetical protein